MRTVGMERYRTRTMTRLRYAYLLLVVLIVVATFFLPGRPWVDAVIAIISSGLIMGASAVSLNQMVKSEELGLGWLVADYVIKIAVAAAAILITKNVLHEDPLLVAIAVIAAAVFTAMVPILAAQVSARDDKL